MMKFFVYMILVFSLILISMSLNPAFSYTEGFEESHPTFTSPPLVCAVEIESVSYNSEIVMKITRNAILEWKGQLQQTERSIKDQYIWDIGYTLIPSTEKNNFDYSKCDVVIRFQEQPSQKKCITKAEGVTICEEPRDPEPNCDFLGETYYKIPIEIYIYTLDGCGTYVSEKRMGTTVLHEFGHALGLGHYVSDDKNINERWAHAETYAPSIMAIFSSDNVKYEQIRLLDIEKVLSLYGENGFLPDVEIPESISKSQITESKLPTFKNYINDEFGFTIKYPDTWSYDDAYLEPDKNSVTFDAVHYPVGFFDKRDGWSSYFEVKYFENDNLASSKGTNYLDSLVDILREDCKLASFGNEGFICSKYSTINSKIIQIDGKSAYQVTETRIETYPDQTYLRATRILTDIPVGNNVWTLDSITESEQYTKFASSIQEMINSFHIIQTNENANTTTTKVVMPDWIRNNAQWWSLTQISDQDFANGLEYLIKEDIINVPKGTASEGQAEPQIPSWLRKNAGWWSQGLLSDDEFLKSIQWMINNGFIKI